MATPAVVGESVCVMVLSVADKQFLDDLDDVEKIKPTPAAIIIATQGSGDARGLEAALTSGAPYIGLIASPKKSARLKETLKKRGYNANVVDGIDAPAGIYIGAITPEEVAVSVLAELVQRRRLGSGDCRHREPRSRPAGTRQRARVEIPRE